MNRPIKFRAWHTGRMWIEGAEDNGTYPTDCLVVLRDNGSPLMQFTGLLDKNGKEIYEGDILKTDSGAHNKVCWRDDFACFCLRFSKGASLNIDGADKYEIIGNIWENPELTTPS